MYESFQALTSIQVSHFVEWFSGDDLDSIWTKNTGAGSPTYAMDDAIDGGFKITLGSTGNFRGGINFNNKRHFAPDESIMIAVWKSGAGTEDQHLVGFSSVIDIPLALGDSALSIIEFGFSVFRLQTSASATATRTSSDISIDTNFHTHKVECKSSSVEYSIDGVLKVTNTTNLPAVAMQPYIDVRNNLAGVNSISITYFEAFNTSVTILSSLYERLSALTQVMGQRMVETFSGALLNERWTENSVVGTPVFEMNDEVDGGFKITCATTANELGALTFNDKRQYAFDGAVSIGVTKSDATATRMVISGFNGNAVNTNVENVGAGMEGTFSTSFYVLVSADATTKSGTDSSVALDTIYHVHKTESSPSDLKYTLDGVLEVTKTTNRPTVKLQPAFNCQRQGADMTGQIIYLEAYNKLTTETDFPSVYELFNELTTVARQHFWEWFDGNDLSNRWTKTDISGTGVFAMVDDLDEGFSVTADVGAPNRSSLNFNDKRPFDETACIMISVGRRVSTAAGFGYIGLFGQTGSPSPDAAYLIENTVNTFKQLGTFSATASSQTNTTVAIDTLFHVHKIECGPADIKLTIDGVLEVTKTTDRPTIRLQPLMFVQSDASPATEFRIRYIEAFNT